MTLANKCSECGHVYVMPQFDIGKCRTCWSDRETRLVEGLMRTDLQSIPLAIQASINLVCAMYDYSDLPDPKAAQDAALFKARKALEGIYGHDMPDLEEDS